MRTHRLNPARPWLSLVPDALLAFALTMASFSVFLQTERVEVPVSAVATTSDAATTFNG